MLKDLQFAREAAIGASEKRLALRRLEIEASDLTSSEQAVPFRVIFGTARIPGDPITPTFNLRAVEIETEVSK